MLRCSPFFRAKRFKCTFFLHMIGSDPLPCRSKNGIMQGMKKNLIERYRGICIHKKNQSGIPLRSCWQEAAFLSRRFFRHPTACSDKVLSALSSQTPSELPPEAESAAKYRTDSRFCFFFSCSSLFVLFLPLWHSDRQFHLKDGSLQITFYPHLSVMQFRNLLYNRKSTPRKSLMRSAT